MNLEFASCRWVDICAHSQGELDSLVVKATTIAYSLGYSIAVPSIIIWSWDSAAGIFGHQDSKAALLNLGVNGVPIGEQISLEEQKYVII